MMGKALWIAGWLAAMAVVGGAQENDAAVDRTAELDELWAEVSRAVKAGDFEGYAKTCHPEGVLVGGEKKTCVPLTKALAKWKDGIDATKAGKIKASVEFRFSQRLGDESTAHETGMFCYRSTNEEGVASVAYIHLQALLVKSDGWKVMMEYQVRKGTEEEWEKCRESEG